VDVAAAAPVGAEGAEGTVAAVGVAPLGGGWAGGAPPHAEMAQTTASPTLLIFTASSVRVRRRA
jgi:hypothetical protein